MEPVIERDSDNTESVADRRRRLAEVFGEVLPETTSDERRNSTSDSENQDRWYRENKPPHHD